MLKVTCRKKYKLTPPDNYELADSHVSLRFVYNNQLVFKYRSVTLERLLPCDWLKLLDHGECLDLTEEADLAGSEGQLKVRNVNGVIHFHFDTSAGGTSTLMMPLRDCEDVIRCVARFYETGLGR
jgi:hypothetical protein